MSHITLKEADNADQQIRDIPALVRATLRCGGQFKEGQRHFHNWADDHNGKLVGDWPLPKGYSLDELQSRCRHAIGIVPPGSHQRQTRIGNYEIGVVESKQYPGTFSLVYDFYGGTLDSQFGQGGEKLLMYYHAEALRSAAQKNGDVYSETILPDGTIVAEMDTTVRMGV
jgi:hypothetical protein